MEKSTIKTILAELISLMDQIGNAITNDDPANAITQYNICYSTLVRLHKDV